MQTVLREKLRTLLTELQPALRLCAINDPGSYDLALRWLSHAQESLHKLRCPEAALLGTLRGKLAAAHDGFRDPAIAGELPPRKALRAAIAVYLGQAEEVLRRQIYAISERLDSPRQDLIKIVTVARLMGAVPPLPPDGITELWLKRVWQGLNNEATQQMHAYLGTALPQVDRLYLLDEILSNSREEAEGASSAAVAN